MPTPRGGARPGAGRKASTTIKYQARMRALIEQMVTPEVWQGVIKQAITQATEGDKDARGWLTPWIVGAVPKETEDESAPKKILEFIVKERNADD